MDRLRGRVPARCFDGGVSPENLLERIARERPDVVLFADAADFGGTPGEVRLLPPEAHRSGTFSTHAPSLELAADYLRERTGALVRVLAIQALTTGPGPTLSEPVNASLDILADRLAGLLADSLPALPARDVD
jgi:hydrogenase 3 maturation protease